MRRPLENERKLLRELWLQNNWLLHQDNSPSQTSFFTREFLTKRNVTVIPHPLYFSVFPIENKTGSRHFDTIEVIEAETDAVLNTLTEHGLQDAFKNGRSARNDAFARDGINSRLIVGSGPKVSFWPDGSTSPGNYELLSVYNCLISFLPFSLSEMLRTFFNQLGYVIS
jgi:hypothetical protein